MRVRDLHDQVSSPARLAPSVDEDAWRALVDLLVQTVREEERAKSLAILDGLVISALALPTAEAVARLIEGVAARKYRGGHRRELAAIAAQRTLEQQRP